jgi:uncharacterized protein (TIGR02145 family)/uncharacterized repeat protein (TIGR02543 family)
MESKALSSIAKTAEIEQKPIPTVKKGHLEGCPDFTVEEMFSGSDSDTGIFRDEKLKWEHRVGENGIDYVNVSHYEMVDGKPAKVSVLFWVKSGVFGIQAFKKDEEVIDANKQQMDAFVKAGCAAARANRVRDSIALAHRISDSVALAHRHEDSLPHNVFNDSRDGKKYAMLSIGGHIWMAENLNYATAGSVCYNNDDSYCARYGRLYSWSEAKAACPAGWRLPNNEEWSDLVFAAGGRATAGKKLKSKDGWSSGGNGADAFGFAALPGGTYGAGPGGGSAAFAAGGTSGRWWSATEHRDGGTYYVAMHNSDNDVAVGSDRSYGFSVRCIREDGAEAEEANLTPIAQSQPAKPTPAAAKSPAPSTKAPPPATVRTVATDPQQWAQVDVFTDLRDGQAYKTVRMPDGRAWMAKNLNYKGEGGASWCYDNDPSNCMKYGRLYTWEAAKRACQGMGGGWRLPTNKDWDNLMKEVGGVVVEADVGVEAGYGNAGKKLKSKTGWNDNGNGTDGYGFSALPGGGGYHSKGHFYFAGKHGYWWSATEDSYGSMYYRYMMNGDFVGESANGWEYIHSARCVKDETIYSLTVNQNTASGGTVYVNDSTFRGTTNRISGTSVTIRALASSGYSFTGWSGAATSTNPSIAITMNSDITLIANFQPLEIEKTNPSGSVKIGNLTWTKQNLNIETPDSWCYENNPANCAKYGRLYIWEAAKKACASMGGGWRLPDTADWNKLVNYAGGSTASNKLKAKSGWNGTDDYGFSALPGGYRSYDGSFYYVGDGGEWWSATEGGGGYAYNRYMDSVIGYVYENYSDKSIGFSVRCVQD